MNRVIRDRISAGRRAFHAVQGLGSQAVPLSPVTASNLYWNIAVPKMAYGAQVLSSNVFDCELEKAHTAAAKQIQGLPNQCANVCIATLGWMSVVTYVEILRIVFLWRLLLQPTSSPYKKVAISRVVYHLYCHENGKHIGPTQTIIQAYEKYGLLEMLYSALETGVLMPLNKFKSHIKQVVWTVEIKRYIATCLLYKSIPNIVNSDMSISMWCW